MEEAFDRAALEAEAGLRAMWLLLKRGKWGLLEDFGVERSLAEPAFLAFERENTVARRLTKVQCSKLAEMVPGLADAALELRLAYALKYYSNYNRLSRTEQESLGGAYREILSRRSEDG